MNTENFFSTLNKDQKTFFFNLLPINDAFSVDWFPEIPASIKTSLILKLYRMDWIIQGDEDHIYCWSPKFPKQKLLHYVSEDIQSPIPSDYRELPQKRLPEITLQMANQCLVTGAQESDLALLLEAAAIAERNHKVSTAVIFYDAIIHLINDLASQRELSEHLSRAFIQAVSHQAGFSFYFPNVKKLAQWLNTAQDLAIRLGNQKLQASLEFLLAQNCWISHRVIEAMRHWNRAWSMVQNLNDTELEKRGLKLKLFVHISQDQLFQAVNQHEHLIGNIESFDNDLSLYVFTCLAMIYTEIGMPQRGLGICNAMRNQCSKQENKPLLALSFLMEGLLLLEIRKLKNSRICLEKALEISKSEDIFSLIFLCLVSLICIESLDGNDKAATDIFNTIRNVPESSWYYLLNYPFVFETFYTLFGKDPSRTDNLFADFLNQVQEEKIFPTVYHMVQRLQVVLSESKSPQKKITKLIELEQSSEQKGSTLELAKLRIAIARLYSAINDSRGAKTYAKKAWDFLKPVARDAFPRDLLYLLQESDFSVEGGLADLIIEMGKALTKHDHLERLLTNIIASISRMTGAERVAIFIKDADANDLKMIASRSLFYEDIVADEFQLNYKAIEETIRSGRGDVFDSNATDTANAFDLRKVIITPLILKDQVIGVLYQDSRFFTVEAGPNGIKILFALASQIALAIDQAKAHDEIAKLNKKLVQENLYYINEKEEFRPFGEIIGSSKAIRDVQKLIRKVAPTQSTVLIYGETGVGKELVARAIHRESSRKTNAFIRVNCAALPESLIDSELFGHEKGAFTGALKTKAGRFELAHQGTIFLDEVSELPPSTQSRLLRILQEKEFQRVGGTKILHSDFRLITATNKDLNKEVEAGRFREDLFYRLNVYPIRVPSLRERREDIPQLAIHYLKLFSKQCNKTYSGITTTEMEKLKAYAWPGNVRELSNIIERAIISGDSKIEFAKLGSEPSRGISHASNQRLKLKEMEKMAIIEALKKSNGKIGGQDGAAELLGMERTTLMYRIKKLGIKIEYHCSLSEN